MPLVQLNKELDKLKISLMMDPTTLFYTSILFSLKFEWKKEIETAGTDGISLFINPDWFKTLTTAERTGLLLHEVMHVALNHMIRLGDRDPALFNQAGDYVINNILLDAGYTLPTPHLENSQYKKYNTEQLYTILYEDKQKQNEPNSIGNDIIYSTKENKNTIKTALANTLLRAKAQADITKAGNIPNEVLLQIEDLVNPKLPWNIILQQYMHSKTKDDYSWHRPNRRFFPLLYLPQPYSESMDHICFAVDASASVTDNQFKQFISEIHSIQEILLPNRITIIDFDTKIHTVRELHSATDLCKIKFHGRGGTDISPITEWARQNKPDIFVIFTDGDFDTPKNPKLNCDTVWVIHNNKRFKYPEGKIIHYTIRK